MNPIFPDLIHHRRDEHALLAEVLATPLGEMVAIFDEKGLNLLEFFDCKWLEREIAAVAKHAGKSLIWQETAGRADKRFDDLQNELNAYFAGKLRHFATPLSPVGTPFQLAAWQILCQIPYAQTRAYSEQAAMLGNPKAVRAVAAANGQNKISLLIPCHRVIGKNGKLVGYAGGMARKQALLALESGVGDLFE
ncbi:MAG: methylated-DNA--[protein]-cysteine S-methyltransferase [Neisseria sp.]|nr:methylated-DNA--[protein]-cysteine S-methyltransferase [Neisseria sp.]